MKRLLIVGAAIAVTAAIGCRTNDGDQQGAAAGTPPYTPPAATTVETATTATVTETPAPVATATTAAATPPVDLSPRVTNVPPTPTQPSAATVESAARIGVDEAVQRVATGQAIIVDVRAADAYRENHIVGAINSPYDQLKTRAGELPKDKYLVTYCT